MLFIKSVIGSAIQVGMLALFLLLPAGSWYWPDALLYLAVHSVFLFVSVVFLCLYYPASLEARLMAPTAAKQPKADKLATWLLLSVFAGSFIFIPFDVFGLKIFSSSSPALKILGLVAYGVGYVTLIITLVQNEFAQPVVNIQEDRQQKVIDTGLYGFVRHPMYASFILFLAGTALWLGSVFVAVFGSVALVLALIPRILIEEKTLKNELPGYAAYTRKVKYRIIPFIY